MTLAVVAGLVGALLLLAVVAAGPTARRSRARAASRRRRHLAANPTAATHDDVLDGLLSGGVAPDQARLVLEKAAGHGVKPFTMWLWHQQFGAASLAIAVAADLSHRDLLTHLGEGSAPDLDELLLFARCNGLTVPRPAVRAARMILVDSGLMSGSEDAENLTDPFHHGSDVERGEPAG